MSDRVRVVRRQGDVEEIRYRKADDHRFYKHATDGPTDLFLVEVGGKRGSLALPRGGGKGWDKIDDEYWLTNPPRRSRRRPTMKRSRKRHKKTVTRARRRTTHRANPARRRRAKRPPPAGYSSWSSYMASIRPNKRRRSSSSGSTTSPGGKMAKRRRRRRPAAARRHTTHRRRSTTRRRYRRNPSFGGRGMINRVIGLAKDGVIGGATMVAGEAASRLVRSRVLNMAAGETMSSVAEAAIGVAGGVVVEKMLGRDYGRDFVKGAMAGVIRGTIKQLGAAHPIINEALSDSGPRIILPRNRAVNGYVRGGNGLAGYVGSGTGALSGELEEQLGYG